jgi:dTDP-4-amino-4,6-dideoxygalactose transaminase
VVIGKYENKEQRNNVLNYSNKNAIMTRPAWTLINELPMFAECQTDSIENARDIADRLVNLPSSVI